MILLFGTRPHYRLIGDFFESWAPAWRDRVRTLEYGNFPLWKKFPGGAVIFSDLERLRPDEFLLAGQMAGALLARAGSYRVLNDPRRYAGRFQLLKMLAAKGINNYRVRRADEPHDDLQFPVFVRHEMNHDGPATQLLRSAKELREALARAEFQAPAVRRQLMVVEYCDCGHGGVFRKYSAMKVGDAIIPRHVLFSSEWAAKTPDLVTDESLREEGDFFHGFPHAEPLAEIFRLAGIDYGRIDYGLRDGKIQTWEINTNPTVVPLRAKVDPRRLPVQSESARRIAEAIVNLSPPATSLAARPFCRPNFLLAKILHGFDPQRKQLRR